MSIPCVQENMFLAISKDIYFACILQQHKNLAVNSSQEKEKKKKKGTITFSV